MLLLGQVCCYPYHVSHTICHKLVYLPQESHHTTGPNVQQKNFRYRKTYHQTSHTDAPPGQHDSESPYICLSITLVSIIMDVSKQQITCNQLQAFGAPFSRICMHTTALQRQKQASLTYYIEKALIAIVYAQCRELSFHVEMIKKELLLDIQEGNMYGTYTYFVA